MDVIYLNIAGFVIKVIFSDGENHYFIQKFKKDVDDLLKGFKVESKQTKLSDFIIEVVERKQYARFSQKVNNKGINSVCFWEIFQTRDNEMAIRTYYHIGLFQFQIVLSNALQILLGNRGFIVHSSAISFGHKAIVFMGTQGSGKSTIVSLLENTYTPISDDTSIIKYDNDRLVLYQTPYKEKNENIIKTPQPYYITAFCFLRKGSIVQLARIRNTSYLSSRLIKQLIISKKTLSKALKTFTSLVFTQSFYKLTFNRNRKGVSRIIKQLFSD